MKQHYYNGSTSKKKIVVTPIFNLLTLDNSVIEYNVKIQDWDSPLYGFVTRKEFKCRLLSISKKCKVYATIYRDEKNRPLTEYFTSSGIKVIQNDYNEFRIKQVGEE